MSEIYLGYSLGLEMLKAHESYDRLKISNVDRYADEMKKLNEDTKIISDFMNRLAHAKKNDKKADFSQDDTAQEWIDHIHNLNPEIFGQKRCVFADEQEIDIVVQALDAELKRISTVQNEHMMYTTDELQERGLMYENAHEGLKTNTNSQGSIINKMAKH